jgi:hypothetical protein
MKSLSKKEFLSSYSSNPEFHTKVLKQGNVEWSLIKANPEDYYAANNGSVSGMIYYVDTVAFAKKYHLQILQILEEFEQECSKLENKPSPTDETDYFNWLSWFAWENMMSEVISFMER